LKTPPLLKRINDKLLNVWQTADQVARSKAVDTIEYEVEELDNIFGVIVLGAFIGIASPPIQITLELLPAMEKEFETMLDKVSTAHDPLGELFSVFSID
jgi:late competence protein required for DNA uptake (superfamily II DNA/RNA helicase)